jgi:hypothetical protein
MRVSANNLSQKKSGSKSRSERKGTNSTSISAPQNNNKKASKSDTTKFVMKHTINNHNKSDRQNKNDNNSTKFSGTGTTYDIKSPSSVLESDGGTTQSETVTSGFSKNNGGSNLCTPRKAKLLLEWQSFSLFWEL